MRLPLTLRRLVTAAVALGLAFPHATIAVAQSPSPTAETRALLERVAALLDPTEHDLDALGLELAFEEPAGIAAWVAENVAYEAYVGVLRGAEGTLVARAGNALDQALLLARLLTDAGYDARIALGALGDADALELVMGMFAPRAQPRATADAAGLAESLGVDASAAAALAAEVGAFDLTATRLYREAEAAARQLAAALGPARPEAEVTAELVAEARRYAWVEYRLSPSEPWTALHPLFAGRGAAPADAAETYLEGEVPAELTHRLRIEMSIERKRGDVFETVAIMTPWERPVADLLGVPIAVGNTALGDVPGTTMDERAAQLAEAAFFAPVLGGGLAPSAQAFDLNGNLVPPSVGANRMAAFFQATAGALEGAMGALGQLGGDEAPTEAFALVAQYLDIVLIAPGGEETTHRRVLFDRRPAEARESGSGDLLEERVVLDGVMSSYVLLVTGGALSAGFVAAEAIALAERHLDILDALAGMSDDGVDQGVALLDAAADLVPTDHLRLIAASDAVHPVLGGLAYRAEPTVVALYGALGLNPGSPAVTGVDIVSNAKRVLAPSGGGVRELREEAALVGAWDTVVERAFLESYGLDASASVPTGDLTVVSAAGAAELARLGVPPRARAAVLAELGRGAAVAFGADPAGPAWAHWRLDAGTGTALGVDARGRGNAATEYEMLVVTIVQTVALSAPGLAVCAARGSSWTCYCDNVVTAVGLAALGFGIAKVFGETAGALWAILDVGVFPGAGILWTPPVCSGLARLAAEGPDAPSAGWCAAA